MTLSRWKTTLIHEHTGLPLLLVEEAFRSMKIGKRYSWSKYIMALLVFVYTFWDPLKVFSFATSRYCAYCFRSFSLFFQPLRTRSSGKEGRHTSDSHTEPLRSVRKGELRAHQERQWSLLSPGCHEGIEFRIRQTKYIMMKYDKNNKAALRVNGKAACPVTTKGEGPIAEDFRVNSGQVFFVRFFR